MIGSTVSVATFWPSSASSLACAVRVSYWAFGMIRISSDRTYRGQVATFGFADIAIDFERNQVTRAGTPLALAAKELELLRYLIDRRGKVVSREELLEGVWEYQPGVSSRTIDVHVAWLRQKLEVNPQSPRHIHTVLGVGYRFVE